jgi:hypothetical protein
MSRQADSLRQYALHICLLALRAEGTGFDRGTILHSPSPSFISDQMKGSETAPWVTVTSCLTETSRGNILNIKYKISE